MDNSKPDMMATLNKWIEIQEKNGAMHPIKTTALVQEDRIPEMTSLDKFDAWMKMDAHERANFNSEKQAAYATKKRNNLGSTELEAANDNAPNNEVNLASTARAGR